MDTQQAPDAAGDGPKPKPGPRPGHGQAAQFGNARRPAVHFIDLENLINAKVRKTQLVDVALSAYGKAAGTKDGDTVVVGVASYFQKQVLAAQSRPVDDRDWTYKFSFVLGHDGDNGADEALLIALALMRRRTAPLAADFGQVAFGSGDHAYVDVAAELKSEGLSIIQVLGLGGRSKEWKAQVRSQLRLIDVPIRKVFDKIFPPPVDGAQESPG